MIKMKFTVILIIIFNYTFSQSLHNSEPLVNICLSDSQNLTIKYNIVAKSEIMIYKDLKKSINCDTWFMDVVFVLEEFNLPAKKYFSLPCNMDIQPVLKPDGTFGKVLKLSESKSPDFYFTLDKDTLEPGKFRAKIKFYYFINNERFSIESKYIYFVIH